MEYRQRLEPRWVLLEPQDRELLRQLGETLHLPTTIAKILLNRGMTDIESVKRFLKPKLDDCYDPFLLADIEDAIDLVLEVLGRGGHLMIFGDYDVDGVTGTSLMTLVFRSLGADVSFYIPDRFGEGYGISERGVEEAKRRGAELIISVDCGITAIREVEFAKRLGIHFIVTDHHEPGSLLPDGLILNPKRHDCPYPFKDLPGVAIAFKFLQGLFRQMGSDPALLYQYLDLVALGCAADVVPLISENRIFVKYGLEQMRTTKNVGLKALLEHIGLYGKEILTGQVAYTLAPRINAIGRLQHARTAVEMLTTDDPEEAGRIVEILEVENTRRKEIDDQTLLEAVEMIEANPSDCKSAIVLTSDEWHQGVIGIVAARIVDKVYLPTILIACDGEIGKGSCRSIPGFDLYEALHVCSDYLIAFGGHKHAAGITIARDQIEGFREAFYAYAQANLSSDDRIPMLKIDAEIGFSEIDGRFVRLLQYLEPFGQQNMRPNFLSRNLEIVGTPRIVGTNHIKFKARQHGTIFDCIGFDMGDLLYRLAPGEASLDLAYAVEENEWNGKKTIQLRLRAIR